MTENLRRVQEFLLLPEVPSTRLHDVDETPGAWERALRPPRVEPAAACTSGDGPGPAAAGDVAWLRDATVLWEAPATRAVSPDDDGASAAPCCSRLLAALRCRCGTAASSAESEEQTHMLAHTDAAAVQKDRPAVNRASVTFRDGELVAIVGPVGCGKSTLLSGLLGEAKVASPHHSAVGIAADVVHCPQQPWIRRCSLQRVWHS